MRLLHWNICIAALALAFAASSHGKFTASVDRTVISDLENVTLTINVTGGGSAQPDLSAIRDFDLISQQSGSRTEINMTGGNQQMVRTQTYTVILEPKRTGKLLIPRLTIGNETTNAIVINVVSPSAAAQQRDARFVFFETKVDKPTAYVQSQVIYSVRLYYADAIGGDFPPAPELPEAVVEPLEGEIRDEAMVNGQRFAYLEKRYAIFPQKSGSLTIPREVFRGVRGRGGFFSQRQQVTAASRPISITVKPTPESFTGNTWIAARSFNLLERWTENPPQFKVGEPVNRIVAMHAVGLAGSLLPLLESLVLDNVKTYADPPVTDENVSEAGIIASNVTTVGIVPTKARAITLPEIRIPWWNTESDREEVAIIPAAIYEVMPADGAAVAPPTVTVPLTEINQPVAVEETISHAWIVALIALGFLWLFSTWQWLSVRQQLKALKEDSQQDNFEVVEPNEDNLFKELTRACKANRAADTHRYLFLWSNARFRTGSLQELRAQLQQDDLDDEIDALEEALYAEGSSTNWHGSNLLKVVKQLRNAKQQKVKSRDLMDTVNP
ncbi:MAG TPA: hypothetical protein DCM54_15935 [Gammaproteobacteria bacterium]|nr:hypothetical protein [Gammaproteobacteria bacterium]